jgi:penicillin-binding protein 1C
VGDVTHPARRVRVALCLALGLLVVWGAGLRWIDATPLPDLAPATGTLILDRDGRLLSAGMVADGRWRLAPEAVDPLYLRLLLAAEDGRFPAHPGVDPLALARAAVQAARSGRIVSGGSTLTMQTARLLEEAPTGDLAAKLRQIRLALALERRLGKDEILALYLTLAPFGGNLEGVRAASLAWLGKEPRRLTPAEAALLVALPQAPEARRPDRHPEAARAARDRVLARAAAAGALDADEAAAARRDPVPERRRPFPALAPHLAERALAAAPAGSVQRLTLDAGLQARLEDLLRARAAELGPSVTAAALVVDHRTGEILARVGASDRLDPARRGFVDMTLAARSPGSTLKPLIYGLGFEAGLLLPETMVEDRPMTFGTYAPQNLDQAFLGPMTARRALQTSRNLPAVAVLDAVGPARLLARLRRAGADPRLPPGGAPGLALALGGLGLRLEDLARVQAAIARGGEAVVLRDRPGPVQTGPRVLSEAAAWHVMDVLRGAPPPANGVAGAVAFKTGTSYGHRDAFAVGFDGAHTVAIWFGRADGASLPGALGLDTAAPALFEAFARIGPTVPFAPPPPEALTLAAAELPQPLRAFRPRAAAVGQGPRIAFPPDGARLELAAGASVALKVGDGAPPFRWLVDGAPLDAAPFAREAQWRPAGPGFADLAVIDSAGRAARASIRIE